MVLAAPPRLAARHEGAALSALPVSDAAGLFATTADLTAALAPTATRLARLRTFLAKAEADVRRPARPFALADMDAIVVGDRRRFDGGTTLNDAISMLTADSAAMRDLALAYALTGAFHYADAAWRFVRAWARDHTEVNFYRFEPDFAAGSHRGQTEGRRSDRPWPFGLNAMWQCYGLINVADTLLLLGSGSGASAEDERAARAWLRRLTSAVDASFHAWTRWADANPSSAAYRRYRSDNHLTWAQVGLLAAAVVLRDAALSAYVLDGAPWDNGFGGAYPNPTPLPELVARVIECPEDGKRAGRIFEEAIGRTPPMGYAMFHLEAMTLAARIATLHHGVDIAPSRGGPGGRLLAAYRRYAAFQQGLLPSPDPQESPPRGRWLFALTPDDFGGPERTRLLSSGRTPEQLTHVVGPFGLLFAPDRL